MGISSPAPNRQCLFQLKGMGFDSLPPQENSRRVPAIEPIVQLPVLQNDRHGGAAYVTSADTANFSNLHFLTSINNLFQMLPIPGNGFF